MKRFDVVVVGAGIAGLKAAMVLQKGGLDVCVVDKARGPGGRCATRRHETWRFNHGAQYFTARDPIFQAQLEDWRQRDVVQPWPGAIALLSRDSAPGDAAGASHSRWVGADGMNGIAKDLARDLEVRAGCRIVEMSRDAAGWTLLDQTGAGLAGRWLVVTAPPRQTAELLAPAAKDLAAAVDEVTMTPCWAVMLGFADDLDDVDYHGAFATHSPISFLARGPQKKGWVAHGSVQWSTENLEADADEAGTALANEFLALTGTRHAPQAVVAHRWRYSMAASPLDGGFLLDQDACVMTAGDWCLGSRIEAAYLSGNRAAARLLELL